MEVLVLIIFV